MICSLGQTYTFFQSRAETYGPMPRWRQDGSQRVTVPELWWKNKLLREEFVNRGDRLTLASPFFRRSQFLGVLLYKLLIFPFVDGSSNVSSICICTWHVVYIYIYLFTFTIHIICLYIYIYRYISGDLRDTRKDMPAIYNDFCQPHPTYFFCQFSLIN